MVQPETQELRRKRPVPLRPGGTPLWVSDGEPGSTPDITAARQHVLPALYKAAAGGLPTLADKGYIGAGIGIRVPVRRPKGKSERALGIDTRTTNTLVRDLRALGERTAAELKERWRTLKRITVSPCRIGDIARAARTQRSMEMIFAEKPQRLLFLDGHMSAAFGVSVPIPAHKHEVVFTRLNVVRLVIAIPVSAIIHPQYNAGRSLPGAFPERTGDAVTVGFCVADHELVTVVDVLHSAAIARKPQGPIAYVSMCRRRREQQHRTHGHNSDYPSDRISYFHVAKHSLPTEAKQYDGDIPLVTLLCGSP